jgi:hypothetical protein
MPTQSFVDVRQSRFKMTSSLYVKLSFSLCLALVPACESPSTSAGPETSSSSGPLATSGVSSPETSGNVGSGSPPTSSSASVSSASPAASASVTSSGGSAGTESSTSGPADSSTATATTDDFSGAGSSSAGSSSAGSSSAGSSGISNGSSGPGDGSETFGSSGDAGAADGGDDADPDELLSIASDFDKFRLECPCIDADHFGPDKSDNCDNAAEFDRQTHPKQLAGDTNVIYDVTLHVRGNTEPNTYVQGELDANGRFYVGGETSTPGYTAYMLTVADPEQVYFFNYNPSTGHIHFLIDYEVTIPMRGGTELSFEVNGGKSTPDGHGVSNREELVVPGVEPAPEPYNGQLVQFDVVSVVPRL